MRDKKRPLFRSTSDKLICGVCGGLAEYSNIDVKLIRLIFLVLSFFGGTILVYFLLAILLPSEDSIGNYYDQRDKDYNDRNGRD